ncbi:unnamed protein product [Rhizophagus irregularis]|nr:unnamed protein product [Rhizophagus irregularis]
MFFGLYYTEEYDGTYCDDPGMKLLGGLFLSIYLVQELIESVLLGNNFWENGIIATGKEQTDWSKLIKLLLNLTLMIRFDLTKKYS